MAPSALEVIVLMKLSVQNTVFDQPILDRFPFDINLIMTAARGRTEIGKSLLESDQNMDENCQSSSSRADILLNSSSSSSSSSIYRCNSRLHSSSVPVRVTLYALHNSSQRSKIAAIREESPSPPVRWQWSALEDLANSESGVSQIGLP